MATKQKKGFYGMAGLAKRYLNHDLSQQNTLFPHLDIYKSIGTEFLELGDNPFLERQIRYGANDVIVPLKIKEKQIIRLKSENLLGILKLENKVIAVNGDFEINGMYCNEDDWGKLGEIATEKVIECRNNLDAYVKENGYITEEKINWNSHPQKVKVAKYFGIPTKILDKNKSTDALKVFKHSVGRNILDKYKYKIRLAEMLIEYADWQKKASSFGLKFLDKNVHPISGRIHSKYHQIKSTGRMSSYGPNAQQYPRADAYRHCFQAQEGKILAICDFSSQEKFSLAHLSQEPKLLDFANNGDGDFHSFTAKQLFGSRFLGKYESPALRSLAKNFNFAVDYGGGAKTLEEKYGIPVKRGSKFIKDYYESCPVLREYYTQGHKKVLKDGYILIAPNTIYERRAYMEDFEEYKLLNNLVKSFQNKLWPIPYKLVHARNKKRAEMMRKSQNFPVQGIGAIMTKLACVMFRDWIINNGYDKRVLMCAAIHDEVYVECDLELKEDVLSALQYYMEKAGKILCPSVTIRAIPEATQVWKH